MERNEYTAKIEDNGGEYNGNLDKITTHLVVQEPTGKKYLAARKWGIKIVAKQWIEDCIKRGMILNENCYDPHLPPEEIGKGAWINREVRRKSLGKRLREAATAQSEGGRRKLRKTASMKLSSQRENMWGQILGQQPSAEQSGASLQTEEPTQPLPNDSMLRPPSEPVSRAGEVLDSFRGGESSSRGIFASCSFCVFGFPSNYVEVLVPHITSRDGTVVSSPEELQLDQNMAHRFVVVPQDSDPSTHPLVPDGVNIVTDFFIEKCVHRKGNALPDPKAHVIGRPFPVFPIDGFTKLSISTGGFTEVDLLHVSKAVPQLGARYEERFTAESSMLMCTSLSAVRKQKLDAALIWGVPVIKADWLWACISQGKRLSTKDFLFPELRSRITDRAQGKPLSRSKSVSDMIKKTTPASLPKPTAKPARTSLPGPDMAAFDASLVSTEPPGHVSHSKSYAKESQPTTQFETAPTNQPIPNPTPQQLPSRPGSQIGSVPLAERSASELNKSASTDPTRSPRKPLARIRSEVCDSEADEDEAFVDPAPDMAAGGEDPIELEKRRLAQEKAAKDAAERLALSNKLNALLEESSTTTTTNPKPSTTSNISFESTVSAAAAAAAAADDNRVRRKRKLMGRALSGASSASQESSSRGGGLARTHSAVLHNDNEEGEHDDEAYEAIPKATQIEYDDPEATRSKARLVNKMLGRSSPGESSAKKSSSASVATAKVGVPGGRSMRRR